ncbi:MAG: hypothetical protein WB780_20435 [Candidatus Acidiferrales bacterium]
MPDTQPPTTDHRHPTTDIPQPPELHITPCGVFTYPKDQPPDPVGIVLIDHHYPERRFLIRCDARCHGSHEAFEKTCGCICDGVFHGIGTPDSMTWNRAILTHGAEQVRRWKSLGIDCSGLEKEMERLGA